MSGPPLDNGSLNLDERARVSYERVHVDRGFLVTIFAVGLEELQRTNEPGKLVRADSTVPAGWSQRTSRKLKRGLEIFQPLERPDHAQRDVDSRGVQGREPTVGGYRLRVQLSG